MSVHGWLVAFSFGWFVASRKGEAHRFESMAQAVAFASSHP